jgi:adenylosuccinate synthase
MSKPPVYIIQGAQWGSEGKGQIAALYAANLPAKAAVRTGSINAGHTVYYRGRSATMQMLPTAWASNPSCLLVLGPGCFIHRETLAREIAMIKEISDEDVLDRLYIDYRCTTHEPRHEVSAKHSGRNTEIGSCSKGSSDAVIERITARGNITRAEMLLFRNHPFAGDYALRTNICDTIKLLDGLDGPVVLEGTQGAHLDVFTGPYPYTSNRAVSTAAWLAYAGISPMRDIRTVLVARTFPIRVAGNSGPMPNETTWDEMYAGIHRVSMMPNAPSSLTLPRVSLTAFVNYQIQLNKLIAAGGGPNKRMNEWTDHERYTYRRLLREAPTEALTMIKPNERDSLLSFVEKTTVTHKIRRIAWWSDDVVREAIIMNGCYEMWLTFLNYKFPMLWGCTDKHRILNDVGPRIFIQNIEHNLGVRVAGVTTERTPECHLAI